MDEMKLLRKYMIPFMEENGFVVSKATKDLLQFEDTLEPQRKVYFSIRKLRRGICPEIRRGSQDVLPSYQLSLFLDEPKEMDPINRDEYWYYDNEEDFVGALEEQAEVLRKQGFAWLKGSLDADIDEILQSKADARAANYKNLSPVEQEALKAVLTERRELWRQRRVTVKTWIVERESP